MSANERANKDKAMAAYLKAKGITRHSAACPNHCGAFPAIGGQALSAHLNVCQGAR